VLSFLLSFLLLCSPQTAAGQSPARRWLEIISFPPTPAQYQQYWVISVNHITRSRGSLSVCISSKAACMSSAGIHMTSHGTRHNPTLEEDGRPLDIEGD
jgi:hypothetical protein